MKEHQKEVKLHERGNTPENNHSQSRITLRSITDHFNTETHIIDYGKRQPLPARNLIGKHGGSGRSSKSDRKAEMS